MLQKALNTYINNFKGFSKQIWILTLMTFINRAGTMVLPFLSKYLKEDLNFTYSQVGWIMVFFGIGSMIGSWLGGKLSDKFGFYKVMVFSLFTTGICFFFLQYITTFVGLCIGMFAIMLIADMFRPAMFVSLGVYAKPENRTRALTLVRLAINLGFAAGPALGGLIIMNIGYKGLFWADSISCITAIIIFTILVKEVKKESNSTTPTVLLPTQSVFLDKPFWLFLLMCTIIGVLFFQVFTTIPLYHKEQFKLTELQSGLLLMMNGLLIFFLEMPIVSIVERKNISKIKIITYGVFIMALSIALLLINNWPGILIIMMIFMTFGEMFAFPFSNSFALSRAPKGHEGRYMAIFTMSYSLAHITSAKLGMEIVSNYNYTTNWIFMALLGLIGVYLGITVKKLVAKEQKI